MHKELSIVKLTHNISKYGLKKGDKGTIVFVYKSGKAYEVEFISKKGKTIAVLTLTDSDIAKSLVNPEKISIKSSADNIDFFANSRAKSSPMHNQYLSTTSNQKQEFYSYL